MFALNDDMSIYITRGDAAGFNVSAQNSDGECYTFKAGDVVRFKVTEKKKCNVVVLQKDFAVEAECEAVTVFLTESDTKIGGVISKPADYWYEVELNPLTEPQTIVGYDEDGAKIFRLFPEGADVPPYEPTPEDIPVVDEELSVASQRPIQNAAVARAILEIEELISGLEESTDADLEAIRLELNKLSETVLSSRDTTHKIEETVNAAMSTYKTEADNTYAAKDHTHTASDVGAAVVSDFTLNFQASLWTYDSTYGAYKATATADGILATDTPIADVALTSVKSTNDERLAAWAKITRIETADGNITLWAGDSAPTAALSIKFKVVR